MGAIFFFVFVIACVLAVFWYDNRGQVVGKVAATMERPFVASRVELVVRRLLSSGQACVRINAGMLWGAAAVTLSADEARDCALALDEGGARRCGRIEVAPDYDTGDGNRMRITFPPHTNQALGPTARATVSLWLVGPIANQGHRLLLTQSEAKSAAALLRRAAGA